MRRTFVSLVVAAAALALYSSDARAFGDTCKAPLQAGSGRQADIRAARAAAISAWQRGAMKRNGAPYADWYYSADRAVNCTWPEPATYVHCVAVASPCARAR